MPKYNSKVQNQIQWQDFNLLKILLEIPVKTLNLNNVKIGIKIKQTKKQIK